MINPEKVKSARAKIQKYHHDASFGYRETFASLITLTPSLTYLFVETYRLFSNRELLGLEDLGMTAFAFFVAMASGLKGLGSWHCYRDNTQLAYQLKHELDLLELKGE